MFELKDINFRKTTEPKKETNRIEYRPYIVVKTENYKKTLQSVEVKGDRKKIWG